MNHVIFILLISIILNLFKILLALPFDVNRQASQHMPVINLLENRPCDFTLFCCEMIGVWA